MPPYNSVPIGTTTLPPGVLAHGFNLGYVGGNPVVGGTDEERSFAALRMTLGKTGMAVEAAIPSFMP